MIQNSYLKSIFLSVYVQNEVFKIKQSTQFERTFYTCKNLIYEKNDINCTQ